MNIKSSKYAEQGRAIALAMNEVKVEKQKSKANAVERREKLLHTAADQAFSGTLPDIKRKLT